MFLPPEHTDAHWHKLLCHCEFGLNQHVQYECPHTPLGYSLTCSSMLTPHIQRKARGLWSFCSTRKWFVALFAPLKEKWMCAERTADMLSSNCYSSRGCISAVISYLGPPAVQPGWIRGLSGDVTHPLVVMPQLRHKLWKSDCCCWQNMIQHLQLASGWFCWGFRPVN